MSVMLLPNNLQALAPLVAKESARYALTGLRIVETKLENATKYQVEATDGKVLGRVEGVCDSDEKYPAHAIPGFAESPNGAVSGVVPIKPFVEMCKKSKSTNARVKPYLGNVACVLSENVVSLGTTDAENEHSLQRPKLIEGRWPTTDEVFPKKQPKFSVFVDPLIMAKLLEVAAAFASNDDESSYRSVRLDFWDENHVVRVRSFKSNQRFDGLLVPMSDSKKLAEGWQRAWETSIGLVGEEDPIEHPEEEEEKQEVETAAGESERVAAPTASGAYCDYCLAAWPDGDTVCPGCGKAPAPSIATAEPEAVVEPVAKPARAQKPKPTPQVKLSAFEMAQQMAAKFS